MPCQMGTNCVSGICNGGTCADNYAWANPYGTAYASSSIGPAIGVDAAGNVNAAGIFTNQINFGCGSHASLSGADIFVVKLTPNGGCDWMQNFGSPGGSYTVALGSSSTGYVGLAGSFTGDLTLGGSLLTAQTAAPATDVFVGLLDSTGGHVWSDSLHSGSWSTTATGAAVDSSNSLIVTGTLRGLLQRASNSTFIVSGSRSDTANQVFVAKIDRTGATVWGHAYGDGTNAATSTGVAVDSAGSVIVVGTFSGTINFGTTSTTAHTSMGPGNDMFVAKLDTNGNHVWTQTYSGFAADNRSFVHVAVDQGDEILLTGGFDGSPNFNAPTGTLTNAGGLDLFAAVLGPTTGNTSWSVGWGGPADESGWAASPGALGKMFVVGTFQSTLNFGAGPLPRFGGDDLFVAELASGTGTPIWARSYGTAAEDDGVGVASSGNGDVFVATNSYGPIDFGHGPLTAGNPEFDVACLVAP